MRLKEPLYGLNISNLHFVFHLGLALAMIFIETRFDELRHWPFDVKLKCLIPKHDQHDVHAVEATPLSNLFQNHDPPRRDPTQFYSRAWAIVKSEYSRITAPKLNCNHEDNYYKPEC